MKIKIEEFADSINLPFPLRDYQWEGVSFLLNSEFALLADDMGLGKTVQTAVSCEILYRIRGDLRVLIIVPSSLKINWEKELKLWAPSLSIQRMRGGNENRWAYLHLPYNVTIASYEDIRIEYSKSNITTVFVLVVLDEAQRIKNASSNTSAMCMRVRKKSGWALSGTPIENNRQDLISIFDFLKFEYLSDTFSKDEIHHKMKKHFLRRNKEEVLPEMPPIIEQEIPLELKGDQLKAYYDCLNSNAQYYNESSESARILAIITKLKIICNYHEPSNSSVKFDVLKTIVKESQLNNKKTIIFSQYVETLKWIGLRLEVQNIDYNIYSGELTAAEKDKRLQEFKEFEGPSVILMSLKAGGVGLNIQEADTVILFDRWWNPALENQAINRAHRFGRERNLHVIKFSILHSIEEHIAGILEDKEDIFSEYIEEAKSLPTELFMNKLMTILSKEVKK